MHALRLPLVLLLVLAAGPISAISLHSDTNAASTVRGVPIKRFMQVGPQLYRGAQPDREGFAFLKKIGIRTIVSLRNDDGEREAVEALGMTFVHIPVTFRPFGGKIPRAAVVKFLAVVDGPTHGPVFLHCRRGADRTGAFVGVYRIVRQGWRPERAYDEARDIGMRWWYPAVKDELAAFARFARGD